MILAIIIIAKVKTLLILSIINRRDQLKCQILEVLGSLHQTINVYQKVAQLKIKTFYSWLNNQETKHILKIKIPA